MVQREVKVLFLSAHYLWAQACQLLLEAQSFKVSVCITDGGATRMELLHAIIAGPHVIVISLDNIAADLSVVTRVHPLIGSIPLLVLASQYTLPRFDDLVAAKVGGILGSRAGVEDLAALIYALINGHADPLLAQYLLAVRPLYHQADANMVALTAHERELLRLASLDLTDQQIASRLGLSNRTVSNRLGDIYHKLGVNSRTGAVVLALVRGWIPIPLDHGHKILRTSLASPLAVTAESV